MKEVTVSNWDDVHYLNGERVEAEHGPSMTLRLDARSVELDLTAEHKEELRELLRPWFEAGQRPDANRHGATSSTAKMVHATGMSRMAASRRYNELMTKWADEVDPLHVKYKITRQASTGKPYYPEQLRKDYAAHLASLAGQ